MASKRGLREAIKSYSGVLSLKDPRKKAMLVETFDALERGSYVFFDLLLALFGGLTKEMVEQLVSEGETKADLLCAVFWFRVMPKDKALNPVKIQPLLASRFRDYFGSEPSSEVLEYFSGNFSEDMYVWDDCRLRFGKFCQDAKIKQSEFLQDLETMVVESHIGFESIGEAWSSMSSWFGAGEKENRQAKVHFLRAILSRINNNPPQAHSELRDIILKTLNCTASEVLKVYAGDAGGSPGFLTRCVHSDVADFGPEHLERFKNKCHVELKKKSKEIKWVCMHKVRAHLEKQMELHWRQSAWSEILKNAFADIKAKNTRNYNSTLERIELKQGMDPLHRKHAEILNGFFESSFFTTENVFVLCPHHLGRHLPDLFESWQDVSESEADALIVDYCNESSASLERAPIVNVLRYLYSVRDRIDGESALLGAKFNASEDQLNRQKVHPATKGRLAFTWSISSALRGEIVSPAKKEKHLKRIDSQKDFDNSIWLDIELLNGGKWERHHVPMFNTRMLEELYSVGSGESVQFRSSRFGYANRANLTEEHVGKIRNTPKQHRRLAKRQMRVLAAQQNKSLSSVPWDKKIPINIRREDGKFLVSVAVKFKTHGTDKPTDFIGYDQNQTANHSWALVRLSSQSDQDAIPFQNLYLRSVATGDVRSVQRVQSREIDQLSYRGLEWGEYKNWLQARRNFVKRWKDTVCTDRNGQEVQIDFTERFEKFVGYKPALYRFNMDYAKLLGRIIRGKRPEEVKEIRQEILEFIRDGQLCTLRLSSLSSDSFELFRKSKGVIHSYFSTFGKLTDEEKLKADEEMFQLRLRLEEARKNKARSKTCLASNAILNVALATRNEACIVGEGDLPVGNKKTSRRQSAKNIDWLARALCDKIGSLSNMHNGLIFQTINPHSTSHQDPFVHNNPEKAMRPRFGECLPSEINDSVMNKLASNLKKKSQSSTAPYYQQGMVEFLGHYGIEGLEDDLRKAKIPCYEFAKIMKQKLAERGEERMIYPRRGGRLYLATHRLSDGCKETIYGGKRFWICNSDHVAAVNIALEGIREVYCPKKGKDRSKSQPK